MILKLADYCSMKVSIYCLLACCSENQQLLNQTGASNSWLILILMCHIYTPVVDLLSCVSSLHCAFPPQSMTFREPLRSIWLRIYLSPFCNFPTDLHEVSTPGTNSETPVDIWEGERKFDWSCSMVGSTFRVL